MKRMAGHQVSLALIGLLAGSGALAQADYKIYVTNEDSNNVSVLPGVGGANFGAATLLQAGLYPEDLAAGDLDADGDADLAVANRDSGTLTVHLNQSCTGGGGVNLVVSGQCPGTLTATVTDATPGGIVAFAFAPAQGNVTIPGGPCAGTRLGLSNGARLVGTDAADVNGTAVIVGDAPAGACTGFLQALDVATCTPSNVSGL